MRTAARALAAAGAIVIATTMGMRVSARPSQRDPSTPATPVIVELFTSEGCSSCPPADRLLEQLLATQPVDGAEVIALGQHVDYWDDLGWKDRFSSAALTNRQQGYSRTFNIDSIYTPQIVVDGRQELVGNDGAGAKKAIARATEAPHGHIRIEAEPSGADGVTLSVSAADVPQPGRGDHDELVVAVTEDRLTSDVRRGENHGRVLSHAAVVRSLTSLGEPKRTDGIARAEARLPIGANWRRENLKIVAFVQEARSRHIVAAAWRPVPSARK